VRLRDYPAQLSSWGISVSDHASNLFFPFSAFILSNETVNIWSHLLGLIYFTLLQFNDNLYFLPEYGGTSGDHMTFTAMNLCFQVCV
jgi:predicted membrane channel-forming protein YqfA (hemolysin III family)